MDRRDFLGLGLLPLTLAAPAMAAADERPMSRAARSGFLPNVPLVTHSGQNVRFYDDLVRDRTVLINFFLVGCRDGLCPTATANLRQVQEILGDRVGRDVFFYSITLTPENDTPAVLAEYAKAFGVKPGWTFLTGKAKDVDHLRRSMGYIDNDPKRDKDPSTHVNMARYGDDRLERWGSVSLRSSASNIASTFKWLTIS